MLKKATAGEKQNRSANRSNQKLVWALKMQPFGMEFSVELLKSYFIFLLYNIRPSMLMAIQESRNSNACVSMLGWEHLLKPVASCGWGIHESLVSLILSFTHLCVQCHKIESSGFYESATVRSVHASYNLRRCQYSAWVAAFPNQTTCRH